MHIKYQFVVILLSDIPLLQSTTLLHYLEMTANQVIYCNWRAYTFVNPTLESHTSNVGRRSYTS